MALIDAQGGAIAANHLAPKCPRRKRWKRDIAPSPPPANKAPRSSFPLISVDNSASACIQANGTRNPKEGNGYCEQSFSTTSEAGGQLICTKEDSIFILDTATAANLVFSSRRIIIIRRRGGWAPLARQPILPRRDTCLGVAGRVRRGGGWVNGFTGSNLGVDWGWFFRRERCSLVAYRCWRLPNGFSTVPSLLISIFFFSR